MKFLVGLFSILALAGCHADRRDVPLNYLSRLTIEPAWPDMSPISFDEEDDTLPLTRAQVYERYGPRVTESSSWRSTLRFTLLRAQATGPGELDQMFNGEATASLDRDFDLKAWSGENQVILRKSPIVLTVPGESSLVADLEQTSYVHSVDYAFAKDRSCVLPDQQVGNLTTGTWLKVTPSHVDDRGVHTEIRIRVARVVDLIQRVIPDPLDSEIPVAIEIPIVAHGSFNEDLVLSPGEVHGIRCGPRNAYFIAVSITRNDVIVPRDLRDVSSASPSRSEDPEGRLPQD